MLSKTNSNKLVLKISKQKHSFTDVLQNRCYSKFCNIYRKTSVLDSLWNKVASLKACNSIKRLQQRCFLVNITKFLRTPFFIEHLCWILLRKWKSFFLHETGNAKRNQIFSTIENNCKSSLPEVFCKWDVLENLILLKKNRCGRVSL